jgi:SAM-dependent methyltransferase
MRKDVEILAELFPRHDETYKSDLDVVGWSGMSSDLATRYATLLSGIDFSRYSRSNPLKLLDLGCGVGLLLDYLATNELLERVEYTGIDLADPMLAEVRQRWPAHRFEKRDIRDQPYEKDAFDYCVICGVFIARHRNTYETTLALAQETLKSIWPSVKVGLSFNSMSKHVDWEREDLFHWPLDDIMAFCKRDLSRHVTFRLDYGLWEGSTLVRKAPLLSVTKVPPTW